MIIWSKTGTYPAKTVTLSDGSSADKVTVSQQKWITFTLDEEIQTRWIFP